MRCNFFENRQKHILTQIFFFLFWKSAPYFPLPPSLPIPPPPSTTLQTYSSRPRVLTVRLNLIKESVSFKFGAKAKAFALLSEKKLFIVFLLLSGNSNQGPYRRNYPSTLTHKGSGCGRAVVTDTRHSLFESPHRQNFLCKIHPSFV